MVVTETVTAPAVPAGVVAVIWVELLTVKLVAFVLPNFTALAPRKLEPVMMTLVPPAVGPELGDTEVIPGTTCSVTPEVATGFVVGVGGDGWLCGRGAGVAAATVTAGATLAAGALRVAGSGKGVTVGSVAICVVTDGVETTAGGALRVAGS